MAEIVRMPLRDLNPGDAMVDSQGRLRFRISDDNLKPYARSMGLVAVCDVSGNGMVAAGYTVVTAVTLDEFEALADQYGQPITLPLWQTNVN